VSSGRCRYLGQTCPGFGNPVLRRDENLDLMDARLSPTGGRAIPVVMLLDESGMEIGWWGSRPAGLQTWIDAEGSRADHPGHLCETPVGTFRVRRQHGLEECASG